MKIFSSEQDEEYYVLYKQNPEPVNPETLYYLEQLTRDGKNIIWMGTCIADATHFTNLNDVISAYLYVSRDSNEEIGVMLISVILNTIPTQAFADTLHEKTVKDILRKLDTDDIEYLKETGILK